MTEPNAHWGTMLDTFLAEDGIRYAANAEARRRVVAWLLAQEMERQGISKAALASACTPAAPRRTAS